MWEFSMPVMLPIVRIVEVHQSIHFIELSSCSSTVLHGDMLLPMSKWDISEPCWVVSKIYFIASRSTYHDRNFELHHCYWCHSTASNDKAIIAMAWLLQVNWHWGPYTFKFERQITICKFSRDCTYDSSESVQYMYTSFQRHGALASIFKYTFIWYLSQ